MRILNFKLFLLLLLFLFMNNVRAFTFSRSDKKPRNLIAVKKVIGKISSKHIEKALREFVKNGKPGRMVGTTGHRNSSVYLRNKIKSINSGTKNSLIIQEFSPDIDFAINEYQQDFKEKISSRFKQNDPIYIKNNGFTRSVIRTLNSFRKLKGQNIIWEKKGKIKPNDVLVIGANYDTMARDSSNFLITPNAEMPGADNNGTGVAILLLMIELLNEMDISRTIRVVFSDFDSMSPLGTKAYVNKYHVENADKNIHIIGYVNLLMLGHDSKRFDRAKRFGNMKAYIRKKDKTGHPADGKLAYFLTTAGRRMSSGVKFELVPNGFKDSGHVNFWNIGIPAVVFTQNWEDDYNPRCHTPDDFVETLNMKTFCNSFRYIGGAIISWAFDLSR